MVSGHTKLAPSPHSIKRSDITSTAIVVLLKYLLRLNLYSLDGLIDR